MPYNRYNIFVIIDIYVNNYIEMLKTAHVNMLKSFAQPRFSTF